MTHHDCFTIPTEVSQYMQIYSYKQLHVFMEQLHVFMEQLHVFMEQLLLQSQISVIDIRMDTDCVFHLASHRLWLLEPLKINDFILASSRLDTSLLRKLLIFQGIGSFYFQGASWYLICYHCSLLIYLQCTGPLLCCLSYSSSLMSSMYW